MNSNPLETTLADITTKLREGRFPNEQAISQGIVLRILQELGWTTWDVSLVWPEYQTGEGRADFALCHPPNKPAVFVEVNRRVERKRLFARLSTMRFTRAVFRLSC